MQVAMKSQPLFVAFSRSLCTCILCFCATVHAIFFRAGGHEKLLRLFDVERPEATPVELTGAPSAIKAAVFVGPSDSLLVSSTGDTPGLTVWDVRGGAVVRSMPTDGPVTSVDVSVRSSQGCAFAEASCRTFSDLCAPDRLLLIVHMPFVVWWCANAMSVPMSVGSPHLVNG
jgi:WD40 repeat protein